MAISIKRLYKLLMDSYGPQGWWPLLDVGYHKKEYSFPKTKEEAFEICVGAILTQNTRWENVEVALKRLKERGLLSARELAMGGSKVEDAIRPTGYFRQKARKLSAFSSYFSSLGGRTPSREELLSLWGIGKETADSILNYAYRQEVFVVDAYTRRFFSALGIIKGGEDYEYVRALVESEIKGYENLQEFHALIVRHEKGKKVEELRSTLSL